MSKTKDIPTLPVSSSPHLTKEEVIDQVLSDTPPLTEEDYPVVGEQILRLLIAQIKGKIEMKTTDLRLSEKIFSKLVPDAPKRVELKATIRPEEYILQAMEANPDSFKKLQENAQDWGQEVEAVNAEFYEVISKEL